MLDTVFNLSSVGPYAAAMEWGFVINQRSGGGAGRRLHALLLKSWPAELICELSKTSFDAWYAPLAERLKGIVTAGGDGTIHWLAHSLRGLEDKPLLLPWPMGTGNDCAKFLGWPRLKPEASALTRFRQQLATVRARSVDHWLLEGPAWQRSMVNYMSLGLDARIALAFDRGRKLAPYLHISQR